VVRPLLKCGADVNAKDKYRGETALRAAVSGGHEVVMRLLLERGAVYLIAFKKVIIVII